MTIETVEDVKRIKKLIQEAELKAAAAQGVLDDIKAQWKEQYGDDTIANARNIFTALGAKIEKQEQRQKELYRELEEAYDWDSLEELE